MNSAPLTQADYAEAMRLPVDKTCGDCERSQKCAGLVGQKDTNRCCQFYPSLYDEKAQSSEQ